MRRSALSGLLEVFARPFRRRSRLSLRELRGSATPRRARFGTTDLGSRGVSFRLFEPGEGPRLADRGRAPEVRHLPPLDARLAADPAPRRRGPQPHRGNIFLHDNDN
ncbi:hypothetical protein GA0074692_3856 [Micromonospora pallida]|uniref:Uncharacterized protein n=1 Tax=Micromonospora pallida TaxID=145854 RepID=A0A1C6SYA0_9ACTN|nr:hypothetical protein [Micromonospora pallida]SCL34536.1 hypothetical protein GA0074692_3856 [Micromonospora pallida]